MHSTSAAPRSDSWATYHTLFPVHPPSMIAAILINPGIPVVTPPAQILSHRHPAWSRARRTRKSLSKSWAQGSPHLTSQAQGSPCLTSQAQGSPRLTSQAQGSLPPPTSPRSHTRRAQAPLLSQHTSNQTRHLLQTTPTHWPWRRKPQ